jgi:hypothetical protein
MRNPPRLSLLLCAVLALAAAGCRCTSVPAPAPGPVAGTDTFAAHALDRYTIHGSSEAWFVRDGFLNAGTLAAQSVVIRDSLSIADGWVETETDRVTDGGLVLRFAGNGDYYLLPIRDDTQYGYANLEIYRAAGNEFTTIGGPLDVSFPPGVRRTIRFQAVGATLTAYLDGAPVLQASDHAYAAGGFGLRHDNTRGLPGVVSRFDVLRWGTS